MDQGGPPAVDFLVGEAEAVEGAGPVVLDEHVRAAEELPQEIPPPGLLQVQGNPTLAPVDGQEISTLALHKGRSPPSGVVALLPLLDLDDVCPGIRQRLRAIRPREDAREVDDANAR